MPDESDRDDELEGGDGDTGDPGGAGGDTQPGVDDQTDPLEFPTKTDLRETLWERQYETGAGDLVPWGLTARQWQFVCEYVCSFNASDAARKAGYSTKSTAAGHQIMRRPRVRAAIDWILRSRADYFAATHERILQELCAIAFRDPADYAEWKGTRVSWRDSNKLDPVKRRAVKTIRFREQLSKFGVTTTTEIEFESKLRALELLAKATGLLREHPETDARGAFRAWRDSVMVHGANIRRVEIESVGEVSADDGDGDGSSDGNGRMTGGGGDVDAKDGQGGGA